MYNVQLNTQFIKINTLYATYNKFLSDQSQNTRLSTNIISGEIIFFLFSFKSRAIALLLAGTRSIYNGVSDPG